MEPRAYSLAPVGTNFLLSSYAYSTGEVATDPATPVSNVEAQLHTESFGYSRTFDFFDRLASAAVLLPYTHGDLSGDVSGEARSISRAGVGDMRFRISSNIIGGEALTVEEFMKKKPSTAFGASLVVVAPTGRYDSERLINIGMNRWVFRPEVGLSQPFGDWFLEGTGAVSFFSDNNNYYGGRNRDQDPLSTFQLHGGYNFSPGLWIALNAVYYSGGETNLDGVDERNNLSNSRMGLTISIPISKQFSLKCAYSEGILARAGSDFSTYLASLQYRWFD